MRKHPEIRRATRARIIAAFFEQYRTMPLRKITVSSLVERAGVNRSTFYDYFSDVHDLVGQAQDELLGEMAESVELATRQPPAQWAALMARQGEQFLGRNGEMMALLLERGDTGFASRLESTMRPLMTRLMGAGAEGPRADLVVSFLLCGITGCLGRWQRLDSPIGLGEVVTLLQSIMRHAVGLLAQEPAPSA